MSGRSAIVVQPASRGFPVSCALRDLRLFDCQFVRTGWRDSIPLTINYSFITMAYIYVVVARATKCLACDRNLGFVSITVVRRDKKPTSELVHVSTETFLCTNGPAHSAPGARLIGSNLGVQPIEGPSGLTRLHGLRLGAKVEYPGYPKNTPKIPQKPVPYGLWSVLEFSTLRIFTIQLLVIKKL